MAEYIGCRTCKSENCEGCNIKILADMLDSGAFDGLMDSTHTIVPDADVVEAVRCKDCIFCEENECTYPKNGTEEKVPEISKYYRIRVFPNVKENHFCGYGKRMAENAAD